jgi:hypothetical protein
MISPTPPRRRWFRFSLRTLFALVTVLCLGIGAYGLWPEWTVLICAEAPIVAVIIWWLWAFVDCMRFDYKLRWPIIILLGSIPGLVLYSVWRRPRRIAERGR